ncbi:MAG: hypothetical protein FJX22_02580, partial [Alphaproteobacteria bacterium]|nr:hypothetical protein [Alphaproteobacteria bacterium]
MTDIDTSLAVDANPDVNQGICLAPRLAMAKLNLTLNIIGRQADGYHFLQSLVVFVRLGDALVFTLAKDNTSKDILQLYGYNTKALPSYNDNLVSRSLSLMRSQLVPDLP